MKIADPTIEHSFVKGAPRQQDLGVVACGNDRSTADRVPHTVVIVWHKGQFEIAIKEPWLPAGVCIVKSPREQFVIVGEYGHVAVFGSGDGHHEWIGEPESGTEDLGALRGARAIEGVPYAVGMARQVYRREGRENWVRLPVPMPESDKVIGFEAIDGFGHEELYAVGWRGEIWEGHGRNWRSITSPTNLILTDVCCAPDGFVYCCGQQGLLFKGRGDSWKVIPNDRYKVDFWGVAHFAGHLYVTAMSKLFRLEDDELVPVTVGSPPATTFYQLSQIDGMLWSTGAKDLMAFDGTTWTRVG